MEVEPPIAALWLEVGSSYDHEPTRLDVADGRVAVDLHDLLWSRSAEVFPSPANPLGIEVDPGDGHHAVLPLSAEDYANLQHWAERDPSSRLAQDRAVADARKRDSDQKHCDAVVTPARQYVARGVGTKEEALKEWSVAREACRQHNAWRPDLDAESSRAAEDFESAGRRKQDEAKQRCTSAMSAIPEQIGQQNAIAAQSAILRAEETCKDDERRSRLREMEKVVEVIARRETVRRSVCEEVGRIDLLSAQLHKQSEIEQLGGIVDKGARRGLAEAMYASKEALARDRGAFKKTLGREFDPRQDCDRDGP